MTSEITQCRLSVSLFDPAPFCAAPRPNQKRSLSIAVSAVIGAALRQYAYDYGELAYSANAKSLRHLRSGNYRVNFRDGNETTAYYTDNLDDAVNTAVEMARKRAFQAIVEPTESEAVALAS